MIALRTTVATVFLLAGLTACEVRRDDGAGDVASDTAGPAHAVNPTSADTTAATPKQAPLVAIQTQPGPNGSEVALERAAVTGNILTVQLRYIGGERTARSMDVRDVSVIDDATSNRIGVLQDDKGVWMAAPLQSTTSDRFTLLLGKDSPAIVWFKFPAPPSTSSTISINLPEVAPFDGVPVAR